MRTVKRSIAALTVVICFCMCTPAAAFILSDELLGFDFRFNNPGARANAMGGAFIGLADDATAAFANPAGLTILKDPEFSMETKFSELTTRIYDAYGDEDYDNNANGLSFLSYAVPLENAAVTIYRHQLVDIENEFTTRIDLPGASHSAYDYKVLATGIGLGLKLTETFSIGMAAANEELDATSLSKSYDDGSLTPPHNMQLEINDESSEQSYTVSFLWSMTGSFNVGAVYRYGPEFTITQARKELVGGFYETRYQETTSFKLPDSYGIGLSYRFLPNLVAAVDVTCIEYSDITDGLMAQSSTDPNVLESIDGLLKYDDIIEARLGIEYVLDVNDRPTALRCGYYYCPDHHIYVEDQPPPWDEKNDDDHVFSIGAGTVISDNIQLDASVSAGDFVKELILSFVYRID